MKVKRSYPLTAVEGVEYDQTHPLQFQLVFSTYTLTLVAENEGEARAWVEEINGGQMCNIVMAYIYITIFKP